MTVNAEYDVAIVGGGLAGLAAAILLSKRGCSVAVFEKEKFPFHKVCGEYVSMESWDFLEKLGLPLSQMQLPLIDTLLLTSANGKSITTRLPLGGFGISRFCLDAALAQKATDFGVHLFEETKVQDVIFQEDFRIEFDSRSNGKGTTTAKICCAAHGKRSNLDVKWKRDFIGSSDKRADNYVGVKYHVKTNQQQNLIGLHNFEGGYCGISKIENDRYCLCYMTKAEGLKRFGGDLQSFHEAVLFQNPYLEKIFSESEFCEQFPITISQISFKPKQQVENSIIMLGDAAGMITPLCGNGMSIALHTAKLAAEAVHSFLQKKLSRKEMEAQYSNEWKKNFESRLARGRFLQGFFGSRKWSDLFVSSFRLFPFLARPAVKMTHGKPF
jgi:menaquinone-9 beta-reductase